MALTAQTFPFSRYFSDIDPDDLNLAIEEMSVQFSGVQSFWSTLSADIAQKKRDLLLSYLVAWHLADMFPEQTENIMNNAGMPLLEKENAGVTLKFMPLKVQEAMYPFLTNTFGIRALSMIMSAPERFGVLGNRGLFGPPPGNNGNGSLV